MRRKIAESALIGILVVAGALCGCGAADTTSIYQAAARASVTVLVDGRQNGSGFFADGEGLVLTAAHVVARKTDRIEVFSPTLGRMPARRLAVDRGHDLALLRVRRGVRPYPTLPVADRAPAPGEDIFIFGAPLFRHQLMLKVAVAGARPSYCWLDDLRTYVQVYFATGPSPRGTSGGCWLDRQGRVVGVQSGYLNHDTSGIPAGVAFSAPPEAIRKLLAERACPPLATLGARCDELWTQPEGYIARFPPGTEGVVTVIPDEKGPVAKAGLNKESLIVGLDGQPVRYLDAMLDIIRTKKPGNEVTLSVMDPDNKPKREVKIKLTRVGE